MEKILIIEDSNMIAPFLRKRIELENNMLSDIAPDYATAASFIRDNKYFACVADLNLPDAPQEASVDLAIKSGIPVIVYTGDYSDELQKRIWKKNIVDYVFKRDPDSDRYITQVISQLTANKETDVIVVDDSKLFRENMKVMLEAHLFRVHVCENGKQAFDLAPTLPGLKLIVSDYYMPDMSGFDLVFLIRKKFSREKLAFIGLSREDSPLVSAKFIKYGANDFMVKPFSHEQFYCRINQNLQMLRLMSGIKEMAYKDYLTGLYNRRYFFMTVGENFDQGKNKSIAMLDIDYFKSINDIWGHETGDKVLRALAGAMSAQAGEDSIIARFGGEEFCIYSDRIMDKSFYNAVRQKIADIDVSASNGTKIRITVSMGVICGRNLSLDAMLARADELMYRAKRDGRNSVCYED